MRQKLAWLFIALLALVTGATAEATICSTCAYISGGNQILAWDSVSNTLTPLPNIPNINSEFDSLLFDMNKNLIFDDAASPVSTLYTYDFATNSTSILVSTGTRAADMALEPSGTSILLASRGDKSIYRINLLTKAISLFYRSATGEPNGVLYDNTGKLFAAIENGTQLAQLDPTTGAVLKSIAITGGDGLTFSTTTLKLYVGSNSRGFYTADTNLTQAAFTDLSSVIPANETVDGVGTAGNFLYLIHWPKNGIKYDLINQAIVQTSPSIFDADDIAPLSGLGSISGNGPSASLAISQSANPTSIPVGSNTVFTITVTNSGPDISTGNVVTESINSALSFVNASVSGGNCSGSGPVVCTLPDLTASGPGATAVITLTVKGQTVSNAATNVATVTSQTHDTNSNNTASATVAVTGGGGGGNPQLSSIQVVPSDASLGVGGQRSFVAIGFDQNGNSLGGIASSWAITGPNNVAPTANSTFTVVTAGNTAGTYTLTATTGSLHDTATVTVQTNVNNGWLIANPTANPNPVTGTTTHLSANAQSSASGPITYLWNFTGKAPVIQNPSSGDTDVSFPSAGTYSFTVTVRDSQGLQLVAPVTVTVVQTITRITVSPSPIAMLVGSQKDFTAGAVDQWGISVATSFTWSATAGIVTSLDATHGRYQAGTTPQSGIQVIATAPNGVSGAALVTVQGGGTNAGSFDLGSVKVYPIPFKITDPVAGITFAGLPPGTEVKVYTLSARMVYNAISQGQDITWTKPLLNRNSERVASGVYFYRITNSVSGQTRKGKLVIIQ